MANELQFEIDDNERRYLLQLTQHPGYRVQRKIMQASLDYLRSTAIEFSQGDPLAQRDELAQKWAYVAIAETLMQRMAAGIEFELGVLRSHEPAKYDPVAMAERRRHILLGELDPFPGVKE